MQIAWGRLSDGRANLAGIAAEIGYGSEAASAVPSRSSRRSAIGRAPAQQPGGSGVTAHQREENYPRAVGRLG